MSEVIQKYLSDPRTPASVLGIICNDLLTEDFLSYEVETVVDSLQAEYRVELPEEASDKIQALQTIYTTNSFYMQIPTFMAVVDAFNDNGVDFDNGELPDVEEVAATVVEVLMNVPDEDMDNLFAPDVMVFIKALLQEEGFHTAPPSLSFVGDVKTVDVEGTVLSDPMIFESYYSIQKEQTDEVEAFVADRIRDIVIGANAVPLKNRDSGSWDKFTKSLG